jgi:hypothetical protein
MSDLQLTNSPTTCSFGAYSARRGFERHLNVGYTARVQSNT